MARLSPGARVAVVGAGPGGLVSAKHAIEAGFEVSVFEASDDLGGQWNTAAAHSGIWPGMRTNTSRAMTAFSDYPAPPSHDLHPLAEQIHDYLRSYSDAFGVTDRIRFNTRVRDVRPAWLVDGEPFDAVIVASGRFRAPVLPDHLAGFTGELLHAFDYPGADHFRDRRVLVYGNGVSGHEIASDIATVTTVISAYRKPRYVLQKNVAGVSSDWQWYTHIGALRRAAMSPSSYGDLLRERVLRVAGNPADYGAPEPSADFLLAGHSLCQDYLEQVRAGTIICRPEIVEAHGDQVTFADGSTETRRRDCLRDRIPPRHPLPVNRVVGGARTRPETAPSHDASGPAVLRRRRGIQPAGAVLSAARTAGPLDRRRLVGRWTGARRCGRQRQARRCLRR